MTTGITTDTTILQGIRSERTKPAQPFNVGGGVNQRRPAADGLSVVLKQVRIFATDLYAVAVVDHTGKLADPQSLRLIPATDLDTAKRAANRLLHKHGGPQQQPTNSEHFKDH